MRSEYLWNYFKSAQGMNGLRVLRVLWVLWESSCLPDVTVKVTATCVSFLGIRYCKQTASWTQVLFRDRNFIQFIYSLCCGLKYHENLLLLRSGSVERFHNLHTTLYTAQCLLIWVNMTFTFTAFGRRLYPVQPTIISYKHSILCTQRNLKPQQSAWSTVQPLRIDQLS